jgi:AraC-like DNA-binding protein
MANFRPVCCSFRRLPSGPNLTEPRRESLLLYAKYLIIRAVNKLRIPAPAPIAKDHLVRAAALEGFLPLMRELGINGIALLVRAGLNTDVLASPDNTIAYTAVLDVLAAAREASGLQHIGLLLAERQPLSMLGPLGFAIAQAPNVGAAIDQLNEYIHLHDSGLSVRLVIEGDLAMWRVEVPLANRPGIRQQEDLAVGVGIGILRNLLGRDWAPELVTLQRRAPINSTPYRQAFRCPVEFAAEHNQTVFESRLLDYPIAQANSQLHAILESHLRGLDASGKLDFATEVQQIILHAMKGGDCSLPRVARMLGTSQRTLQRRLTGEGRTFRDELETVRSRVAKRYLEETAIPLTSLSMTLGYSDLAAFSHAFRRVTGSSPSAWRNAHRLSA